MAEVSCPFCRGRDIEVIIDDQIGWEHCKTCGATGPIFNKRSEPDEISWDNRVPDPALHALKKALEFYAAASTYQANGHPQIDADTQPIKSDNGYVARTALAKLETDNG